MPQQTAQSSPTRRRAGAKIAWDVAYSFFQNADLFLTHQALLSHAWGWEHIEETDYCKEYIHRLRKKIERDPNDPLYIITERGLGYRFRAP